MLTRTVLEPE